jgi:hypothetical protein
MASSILVLKCIFQSGAACNQLNAVIKQVNSLIRNHSLTQAQGQVLIEAVNALKTNLGC